MITLNLQHASLNMLAWFAFTQANRDAVTAADTARPSAHCMLGRSAATAASARPPQLLLLLLLRCQHNSTAVPSLTHPRTAATTTAVAAATAAAAALVAAATAADLRLDHCNGGALGLVQSAVLWGRWAGHLQKSSRKA